MVDAGGIERGDLVLFVVRHASGAQASSFSILETITVMYWSMTSKTEPPAAWAKYAFPAKAGTKGCAEYGFCFNRCALDTQVIAVRQTAAFAHGSRRAGKSESQRISDCTKPERTART
jgi:hypothetical protein